MKAPGVRGQMLTLVRLAVDNNIRGISHDINEWPLLCGVPGARGSILGRIGDGSLRPTRVAAFA